MGALSRVRTNIKFVLASLFTIAVLGACSQVSVDVDPALGNPTYPPTDPNSVQILKVFPSRPFVNLATIMVEPTGSPTTAEIESKLRAAAAQLGANAAVIVADRTVLMGATIEGGLGMRQLDRDYERVIDTVAIRFTDKQLE
ncbi:MAG: hypothetical protein J0M12_03535 [Deltaproteobacteria bacterium]|nr:hypothetical protein [Deltaproteobacteria bacterium]